MLIHSAQLIISENLLKAKENKHYLIFILKEGGRLRTFFLLLDNEFHKTQRGHPKWYVVGVKMQKALYQLILSGSPWSKER